MSLFRLSVLACCLALPFSSAFAQNNLNVAKYTAAGELQYPPNLDAWIQTGASIGGDYSDKAFDPQHPGTIGVVQMEPTAYRYFLEHKTYADGTMFLLSFYKADDKNDPKLQGYVQGALASQEIHVIDKTRKGFDQNRGFFIFSSPQQATSTLIPPGNPCVVCHMQHGKFEGTFAQFYPTLRERLGIGK